jgi:hypothetical protein
MFHARSPAREHHRASKFAGLCCATGQQREQQWNGEKAHAGANEVRIE